MDGTLEFIQSISDNLLTLTNEIYMELATEDATYPFITLEYQLNDTPTNGKQDGIIDIYIWDNKTDLTDLEQLTSDVVKLFNYKYATGTKMSYATYKSTRQNIPDPDETIKRRWVQIRANVFITDITD